MSGCRVGVFADERTCLLCDEVIDLMLGMQWVAQFKCVSVENLVEWMVLWKTFVDDMQELSPKFRPTFE